VSRGTQQGSELSIQAAEEHMPPRRRQKAGLTFVFRRMHRLGLEVPVVTIVSI
jgi:hypothetical protein